MNTSRTTSVLSKPVNGERIPNGVIEYINTRNRMRLFSVVQEEFIKSGLTQAELAHRMGKGTDRICHILGSPGNWTSDTASALIFSMLGGVIQYSITYPLETAPRNLNTPEWLEGNNSIAGTWLSTEGQVFTKKFGGNGTSTTISGYTTSIITDTASA